MCLSASVSVCTLLPCWNCYHTTNFFISHNFTSLFQVATVHHKCKFFTLIFLPFQYLKFLLSSASMSLVLYPLVGGVPSCDCLAGQPYTSVHIHFLPVMPLLWVPALSLSTGFHTIRSISLSHSLIWLQLTNKFKSYKGTTDRITRYHPFFFFFWKTN